MEIGVYISIDLNNIFDDMKSLKIDPVNKIIGELIYKYYNAHLYTKKISLTDRNLSASLLSDVFGDKYTKDDLKEFMRVFGNMKKLYEFNKERSDKVNMTSASDLNSEKSMGKNKRQIDIELQPMRFTNEFSTLLDKIDDVICWELFNIEDNKDILNRYGIKTLDVSKDDYFFRAYYDNNKSGNIRIADFIRAYTGNQFTKIEVQKFINSYNNIKNRNSLGYKSQNIINVPEFKFNPKDVRSTFISLVTETYPHGTETEVLKYLPDDLTQDEYGNYYKIIGKSDTMFTSHLDTASRSKSEIVLVTKLKGDQEMIMSDGTTILGADDKAGVTVMLYLIAHNIPGFYYFFIGEERGGIGSGKVADRFYSNPLLRGIKKVVSFDRRNYYSIITSQYGMECCSNQFGESLCKELNKSGLKLNLDPTGVFTDSANFIDYVPECTNVSVGYFNEHTHDEVQNITYLASLAKACLSVDWENLTIRRKVGFDIDSIEKYEDLIGYIKSLTYYNDVSVKGIDGKVVILIEFDNSSLMKAYDDLSSIETALLIHKFNPDINFDGDTIKIKLT